jgi:hypothetical protein
MRRLTQFLGREFAEVLSQLGFSPLIENRSNLLALDPEPAALLGCSRWSLTCTVTAQVLPSLDSTSIRNSDP